MEPTYQQEIKKGLLVAAVLKVISKDKVYAGEILAELNKTIFKTQEGTLYPLLSRLKREGLLVHEWIESPNGPPRKYYSLSRSGKEKLDELLSYLKSVEKEINNIKSNKPEKEIRNAKNPKS